MTLPAETTVGNQGELVVDEGVHGSELWVSDGTSAGTVIARDIQPD